MREKDIEKKLSLMVKKAGGTALSYYRMALSPL